MELSDWIKIVAVLLAAIGLIMNAIQLGRATRQRRIEQVTEILWKLYDDEDLREIYYKIEYNEFEYEQSNFHGSDIERKLDKLLALMDSIAKLTAMGLIKKNDLELISYEYLAIYQNRSINQYFNFLDNWAKNGRGLKRTPFDDFRRIGKILEKQSKRRRYYF